MHDPALREGGGRAWTPRGLRLDLAALNLDLNDRDSINSVLDAVIRLQAARAIDHDRARSILRACELAIRNLRSVPRAKASGG